MSLFNGYSTYLETPSCYFDDGHNEHENEVYNNRAVSEAESLYVNGDKNWLNLLAEKLGRSHINEFVRLFCDEHKIILDDADIEWIKSDVFGHVFESHEKMTFAFLETLKM